MDIDYADQTRFRSTLVQNLSMENGKFLKKPISILVFKHSKTS